jgi:hypothetical protein
MQLQSLGHLGPTHLLLAHDIVVEENQKIYEQVFRDNHNTFDHVVLDNSVVELGDAQIDDVIKKAGELTLPTCVVLPDVQMDGPATLRASQEGYIRWQRTFPKELQNYMMVPQGKTLEEFVACAEEFVDVPNINYWGVPRNLLKNLPTRMEAIEILHILAPDRHIHMLGFSDNMIDDIICARNPKVLAIDSAVPLRCPELFHLTWRSPPRASTKWWEEASADTMMISNIYRARAYCNG